jgi:hypothetical protein
MTGSRGFLICGGRRFVAPMEPIVVCCETIHRSHASKETETRSFTNTAGDNYESFDLFPPA